MQVEAGDVAVVDEPPGSAVVLRHARAVRKRWEDKLRHLHVGIASLRGEPETVAEDVHGHALRGTLLHDEIAFSDEGAHGFGHVRSPLIHPLINDLLRLVFTEEKRLLAAHGVIALTGSLRLSQKS